MNSRRRAVFVLFFLDQFLASQKKKKGKRKKTLWNNVILCLTVWRTCDLSLDQELCTFVNRAEPNENSSSTWAALHIRGGEFNFVDWYRLGC